MGRVYVALDLETTGFDAGRDEIIEIGAVKFRVGDSPADHEVLDTFETFVNPRRTLPFRITHLTGITQADVDRAPPLTAVLPEVERFVGDRPVVGHSIGFDLKFLREQGAFIGTLGIDTFELANVLIPDAARYSLGKLADHLDLDFPTRHRALDDADMSYQLFVALWETACTLPGDILHAIARVAVRSEWNLQQFFTDAVRVQGVGNTAPARGTRVDQPIPPNQLKARDDVLPPEVDIDELCDLLGVDGPLAGTFINFEHRPQQVAMLEAVATAFNEGGHLLVEAGTGTGKSLAYLLPAVKYAVQAEEHVIVSTNTINLQEQLYHEDLPRLQDALDIEFNKAQLKGRSNYVCPRRVQEFLQRDDYVVEEARLVARVLVWLPQTETGDRSELLIMREEEPAWQYLCADAHACRLNGCAHGSECFFYHAHAMAEGAHIVIINHALLLSDLAMDNMILPEHRHVIVDEAHHLEDQATDHLGGRVRKKTTLDFLEGLSTQPHGRPPGAFTMLQQRLQKGDTGLSDDRTHDLQLFVAGLVRQSEQGYRAATRFFETVMVTMDRFTPRYSEYDAEVRLQSEVRMSAGWQQAVEDAEQLVHVLDMLSEDVQRLLNTLEEMDNDIWAGILNTLLIANRTLYEISSEVTRIVVEPEDNDICWVRVNERYNDLYLYRAPLHVGHLLDEMLFDRNRSVIMTSATLQSNGGFAYIRERLGIEDARELSVGSPFRYRDVAMVYVPTDLPEPNSSDYNSAVERGIVDLARATGGRMLILCTSKSQLRSIYANVSRPLAMDDIVVLAQYMDGGRRQLVERFKDAERAVLLGTRSFWEGVDVPGESLSCLVITRLPFPVPSDPVIAARSETYNEPFYQYTVPQTILRFRQGFGRLIRSQQDRGIVAILDVRVTTKGYGRHFLAALPAADIRRGPMHVLPPLAERWLVGEDGAGEIDFNLGGYV